MSSNSLSKYLLPLTIWAVGVVILQGSGKFRNEAMHGIIHADAQGYYGYLVAGLLEYSFDWEQVRSSYAHYYDGNPPDFTRETEFGRVDKYFAGIAVLILPFFLLSCGAAYLFGFPVDGYSLPFHLGVLMAALFYCALGMFFLVRFLRNKGIDNHIAWFVSLSCFFGTGLFHYSMSEPAMSHPYSFALISAFMFLVHRFSEEGKRAHFLWAAAVYGLIVLVRPTNGLVLLAVPFLMASPNRVVEVLRSIRAKDWLVAGGVAGAIVGIQLLMYWLQVGKPIVWSYAGEKFDFSSPEIMNVLFSYRKGLFVYTPWAFVGTLGLVLLAWKKRFEGLGLLLFLLINVYIISSWWSWYYGSSFGMRALIEYLPFMGFGMAYLLQSLGRPLRMAVGLIVLLTIPVNLIQSYQYQKFILHWDQMDSERYWKIFLRTDRKYDGIFYREPKVIQFPSDEVVLSRKVFETDLEEDTSWGKQGLNEEKANSGKMSTRVMKGASFGSTLGVPATELGSPGEKMLYVRAMVWAERAFPDLSIAYSFRSESGDYAHTYISIGGQVVEGGQWTMVEELLPMLPANDDADTWVVYPMSESEEAVYVDDLHYEIITIKQTD